MKGDVAVVLYEYTKDKELKEMVYRPANASYQQLKEDFASYGYVSPQGESIISPWKYPWYASQYVRETTGKTGREYKKVTLLYDHGKSQLLCVVLFYGQRIWRQPDHLQSGK